jgi:hypothetical protein
MCLLCIVSLIAPTASALPATAHILWLSFVATHTAPHGMVWRVELLWQSSVVMIMAALLSSPPILAILSSYPSYRHDGWLVG